MIIKRKEIDQRLIIFQIFRGAGPAHCDPKVTTSYAIFDENFTKYFVKTKPKITALLF